LIPGNTRLIKKAMKGVRDFSEITTIQGLEIIFDSKQTIVTRIFWLIVVIWMSCMGVYWSIEIYNNWVGNPVLTTIKTTGQSVKAVEFPSITICSPGNSEIVTNAKLLTQFKDYLLKNLKLDSSIDPLHLAKLLVKVRAIKNIERA
jgi:hypothetical protein